jgi:peptide-methionine (S)-S-oxide reductase
MTNRMMTILLAGVLAAMTTGDAMSEEKAPFDKLDGVLSTTSGYTGGKIENPTYKEVCAGTTGHAEALRVEYDPARITYRELLEVFWRNVDPTTPNRQFCDYGDQYRPEIFYHDDEQKRLAEASKANLEASGLFEKIAVRVTKVSTWYDAEDYHQDFYKKDPDRYYSYRKGCGRDDRLGDLWDRFEGPIVPEDA